MDKFSVDFDALDTPVQQKEMYKLADVQDRIEKVAFGVVRYPADKPYPKLWEIVQGDNGEDYIVAMYEDEDASVVKNAWTVQQDSNKSATIFYKNTPMQKVAFVDMGISKEEVPTFKRIVAERLLNNKELVSRLINSLDENYRNRVVSLYPELTK